MHSHALSLAFSVFYIAAGLVLLVLWVRRFQQDKRDRLRNRIMLHERHLPPQHRSDLRYLEHRANRKAR